MSDKSIIVTLSLPPNELKPNARPHHMAKAKKKAEYRAASKVDGMIAAYDFPHWKTMPWTEVSIEVTYYHKTRAFADRDNILASLKSAFDGLVDAGLLTDDRDVTYLPVIREHDKCEPRVELLITDNGKETG